jgi:DNA mismatch endonuclease (patch repair protein)
MADRISKAHRSWNMSRIRGKDTKPEKLLRSALHRAGFRFRLHSGNLPGKPDIVLPKYRTVIFVHGCYWHRHSGCRHATTPKSNIDLWNGKFAATVERDLRNVADLEAAGWRVLIVWECEIEADLPRKVAEIKAFLGT